MRMQEKKNREYLHAFWLEQMVDGDLDSILKSRDITLSTKVRLVRLCVFQWSCMDVRVGV